MMICIVVALLMALGLCACMEPVKPIKPGRWVDWAIMHRLCRSRCALGVRRVGQLLSIAVAITLFAATSTCAIRSSAKPLEPAVRQVVENVVRPVANLLQQNPSLAWGKT